MKCDEFEQRLDERLDARAPVETDPLLAEHASECAACCKQLRLYEALFEGLDARPAVEPNEGFALRVLGQLRERPARLSGIAKLLVPLSLAAGLLIVLRPAVLEHPPTSEQIEATTPQPAAATSAVATTPPPVRLDQEDYLAVFRLTGQAMATLPETVLRTASDDSPVAHGIRPLTHSVSAALDAVRRTLPSKPAQDGETQS